MGYNAVQAGSSDPASWILCRRVYMDAATFPRTAKSVRNASISPASQLSRVPFAMEQDVTFGPLNVSVFGPDGIGLEAEDLAHLDLVHQARLGIRDRPRTAKRCSLCPFNIQAGFDRSI